MAYCCHPEEVRVITDRRKDPVAVAVIVVAINMVSGQPRDPSSPDEYVGGLRMTASNMKKNLFILLILILPLLLTGCVDVRIAGKDGGVFRSPDKGEIWQQKVFVERIKKKQIKTIANANISQMIFHPIDSKTIYLTTREDGAWLTEDGGEKWSPLFTTNGRIDGFVPHPKSKNIIYLSQGQRIFKTTDGGKEWAPIYLETKLEQFITFLAIDFYDPKKIYAGISDGRLIRSLDEGESWKIVKDFEGYIKQILINPKDTRIIYVVVSGKGIFRSADTGKTWQEINAGLNNYSGAKQIQIAIFDQTQSDALMIASLYGLLKTNDGGKTWQPLKLLTQPGTIFIYSLALNPKNSREIYYGTGRALYKSDDGGSTWITKSLPTGRAASYLLVDPDDPDMIYLGAGKVKK